MTVIYYRISEDELKQDAIQKLTGFFADTLDALTVGGVGTFSLKSFIPGALETVVTLTFSVQRLTVFENGVEEDGYRVTFADTTSEIITGAAAGGIAAYAVGFAVPAAPGVVAITLGALAFGAASFLAEELADFTDISDTVQNLFEILTDTLDDVFVLKNSAGEQVYGATYLAGLNNTNPQEAVNVLLQKARENGVAITEGMTVEWQNDAREVVKSYSVVTTQNPFEAMVGAFAGAGISFTPNLADVLALIGRDSLGEPLANSELLIPVNGSNNLYFAEDGAELAFKVAEGRLPDIIDVRVPLQNVGTIDNPPTASGGTQIVFGSGAEAFKSFSGASKLYFVGGSGFEEIRGSTAVDIFFGGEGDDKLRGFGGEDILIGGQDDDELFGGSKNDKLFGDDDRDANFVQGGNDKLFGESGDDLLDGGGGDDILNGGAGEDRLFGGEGDDQIEGGDDDDIVEDLAGRDLIRGMGGADVIDGGISVGSNGSVDRDRIEGGSGGDTIAIYAGEVFGQGGNDTITASAAIGDVPEGGAVLYGGSGNDRIDVSASTGSHNIFGGSGYDDLIGNGNSVLRGGTGADTFFVDAGDTVLDNEAHDRLVYNGVAITESTDLIIETGSVFGQGLTPVQKDGAFIDITEDSFSSGLALGFIATGLADDFDGTTSSILYDLMIFENVNWEPGEFLSSSDAVFVISGFRQGDFGLFKDGVAGLGLLHNSFNVDGRLVFDGVSYGTGTTLARDGDFNFLEEEAVEEEVVFEELTEELSDEFLEDFGQGNTAGTESADFLIGSGTEFSGEGGADRIVLATSNDAARGGLGGDLITGNGGNDTLRGDGGDDRIFGDRAPGGQIFFPSDSTADGNDSLLGGSGNDSIYGGSGSDTLLGGNGRDQLNGEGGNDNLDGGGGDDTIDGGEGVDQILGGLGNDSLLGGDGDDTIAGGDGDDTIKGDAGVDDISGGLGNDSIIGGSFSDVLRGDEGEDTIRSTLGNDTIIGGEGDDTLIGSTGNNRYYYSTGDGNDRIGEARESVTNNGIDRLIFTDIASSEAVIQRFEDNLVISLSNDTTVTVSGQYGFSSGQLEFIDFTDTTVDLSALDLPSIILGTDGDDILTGRSFDDELFQGLAGNDTLDGSRGNDLLEGGDGDDQLFGGRESDTLYGDAGNDILDGGRENDQLFGGQGDDELFGGDEDDTLEGGAGDDFLNGGNGNDAHFGGAGNDTIIGNSGLDSYDGGDDVDTLDFIYFGGDVTIDLPQSLVTFEGIGTQQVLNFENFIAGGGNDRLIGTAQGNALFGGNGDDTLEGGAGDDFLNGGNGNDAHFGGAGDDTILGNSGADTFDGGVGFDILDFTYTSADTDFDLVQSLVIRSGGSTEQATNFEAVFAGSGRNSIIGNEQANILDGGAGDDQLTGGLGADIFSFVTGDGTDTITDFELGLDSIEIEGVVLVPSALPTGVVASQDGSDLLIAYGSSDTIRLIGISLIDWEASSIGETITGTNAADTLDGGVGDDTISGLNGADVINGGNGDDVISGVSQYDTINGGAGDDQITGDNGRDLVDLGAGNDLFTDNGQNNINGHDTIIGGSGNDTIIGGGGEEVITGGLDDDLLSGGISADTFIFETGDGQDTITDFDVATDVIEIDGVTLVPLALPAAVTATADGADVVLSFGSGDSIRLEGGTLNDWIVTTDPDQTITGTNSADTLTGGSGADTISGANGADVINGGDGDDIISGGSQYDTINGGNGDDEITGDNGRDLVDLGAGNDLFTDNNQTGTHSHDTIIGGAGNDTIIGGGGDEVITGGLDNDLLSGGGNADTFIFATGDGQDTITDFEVSEDSIEVDGFTLMPGALPSAVSASADGDDVLLSYGAGDTIRLLDSQLNDWVDTTDPGQTINGTSGADTLDGGSGPDTISGANGTDLINGGEGDDVISGGSQYDTINGGSGDDQITGDNGRDLIDLGDGNDLFTDNNQTGTHSHDTITGGAGNDTIIGGGGDEVITGGLDDDVLTGGGNADTFIFATGDGQDTITDFDIAADTIEIDSVTLTPGSLPSNVTASENGSDVILSYGASDTIRLEGGNLSDWMATIDPDQTITGTPGADTLNGGSGADTISGENGADVINGGDGNDLISGGSQNDTIMGGPGNDTITGGDGEDVITGGTGIDVQTGGAGADTFIFATGDRFNIVNDFEVGVDTIEINGVTIVPGALPNDIIAFEDEDDGGVIIDYDDRDSIFLITGNINDWV